MKTQNKMTKIDLSEFEIFEKLRSACSSTLTQFLDTPLISVSNAYLILSENAIKMIGCSEKDTCVLSMRNNKPYFAILPFDSKIHGYKMVKNGKHIYSGSISVVKRGFKTGIYELKKPVFVGGIDWFELEIFKID